MSIWTKGNVVIEFMYLKMHIHSVQIFLGGWFLVILYNNKCENGMHVGFNHHNGKHDHNR
jgi:hypothetical protein